MTSTTTDQITGFSGSLAVKQPVRLATTAPIVLEGLFAIDGVVPAEGDRILVKDQADASQNGIYIASSGVWSRAVDIDATGKVVKGTQVWATDGVSQPGTLWFVTAANPIVLGTTLLTWQIGSVYQAAAAMAVAISGAVNKAPPVAADKFGYWDSVSTGLRQLTWAQMLTALAVTFLPLAGGTLTGSLLLDDTTDVAAAPPLAFDGDANTGIGHPGADRLAFITAGVQRAEFTAAGALDLLSGQMKFPATANPSSDANTLDDYEEGTWTPTLTFGNLAVGMTYANRSGTYCKVGRQVSLVGTFALSAKGSSTGTARLGGLPFTSMAQDGGSFIAGYTANLSTITGAVMGTLGASATTANLTNGNGNPSNLSDTNFANNSQINFAGTYHAT